ncbi:hypothetical protein LJC49_08100 [Ruminococcaceae bacterium OttesenSCG-928-I18]|nr:hypothetical protein [Ruminococcaceae bacterium OttesenSCG-928-I18]
MSSTNKTPNLELSQFEPSDIPQWQDDYNADMEKIDEAVDGVLGGLSAHVADTDNPHEVTAAQTGALTEEQGNDIYARQTTGDMTLWVATDGSDTAGDGSEGNPYLTFPHAIRQVPQVVNHTVTINVKPGRYAHSFIIDGFSGRGTINVFGATTLAAAPQFAINNFQVHRCHLGVIVRGFAAVDNNGFSVYNSRNVGFQMCECVGDASKKGAAFYALQGSDIVCTSCKATNKNAAFYSNHASSIFLIECSGTGNRYALYADLGGMVIVGSGTNVGGTYPTGAGYGGMIFKTPSSVLVV